MDSGCSFSLRMLAGPIQHFQSAIFEAWQLKVSAQLADRKVSRGAQFPDVRGSLQQLTSSHLRERDKNVVKILPGFGIAGESAPRAASLGQLADRSLEQVMGAIPVDDSDF